MSWMRLDDGVMGHEKMAGLSDSAFRLWMAGLAHCCQQGNDGVFSKSLVRVLFGYLQRPNLGKKSLKELLDAGLWIDADTCYKVHDFLVYQKSKEERASANLAASERMRKMRLLRQPKGSECYSVTPSEHDANFARSYSDVTPEVRSSRPDPDPLPRTQNLSNLSVSVKSAGTSEPSQPDLPLQPQQAAVGVDEAHKSQPEATGQTKAPAAIPKSQVAKQIALALFGELQAARKRCNLAVKLDPLKASGTHTAEIERCLRSGVTPDQIRHVIACWEALVKSGKREREHFNSVTPFRAANVAQYIEMTLEDAAKPRPNYVKQPTTPEKPKPQPREPSEWEKRRDAFLREQQEKSKETENNS